MLDGVAALVAELPRLTRRPAGAPACSRSWATRIGSRWSARLAPLCAIARWSPRCCAPRGAPAAAVAAAFGPACPADRRARPDARLAARPGARRRRRRRRSDRLAVPDRRALPPSVVATAGGGRRDAGSGASVKRPALARRRHGRICCGGARSACWPGAPGSGAAAAGRSRRPPETRSPSTRSRSATTRRPIRSRRRAT